MPFSPITDLTHSPAIASSGTTQRPDSDYPTWRDAFSAVESGSWAVLISIGIIWVVSRKTLAKMVDSHIEFTKTLKDNQSKIAETQEKIGTTLGLMEDRQEKIEDVLESFQRSQPIVIERQKQQIQLLQGISAKLRAPIPIVDSDKHPEQIDE